jgi:hypothetical protein
MAKDDRPDKRARFRQVVTDCSGRSVKADELLHIRISVKAVRGTNRDTVDVYLTHRQIAGGHETINPAVAKEISPAYYYVTHNVVGPVDKETKQPVAAS